MNLSESFAAYLPWIEDEMRSLLSAPGPDLARHYGIMQYHMGWLNTELNPAVAPSGKRLRPVLCLLACSAAGGDPRQAVPAAAGLELMHNFSLIHDDIEDDSATRRHRATAWTVFGLPLACNAGDAMLSLAHMAFHRLTTRHVSAATALRALRVFDETCVCLTEGQYLDMSYETRVDVTVSEYFAMIDRKTGALLAAAPEIGALVAGASSEVAAAYRRFGRALGSAFQLQDDVLGIWGDESVTGKSAAGDILSKKKSLPVVYALENEEVGHVLRERYAGPAFTTQDVPAILAWLGRAGSRHYVEARARDAMAEARQALLQAEQCGAPGPHDALAELLDSLSGRSA
jgi:geranylgeranyl diphosphate synthase, type I